MLTRTTQLAKRLNVRQMSSLLVPLEQKAAPLAEMQEGFPMTDAFFHDLHKSHEAYNEKCANDLKEMVTNKIDNILDKGGIEGWNEGENLDALTKSFEFDSFEQANHFIQSVGNFAEKNDHHPEWSSSNGGRTVNVRLTSHFANRVTLFDFELAQHMNKEYKGTQKSFNMFPRYNHHQFASLIIGGVSAAILLGSYTWLRDSRRIVGVERLLNQEVPMTQLEGESAQNHEDFIRNL